MISRSLLALYGATCRQLGSHRGFALSYAVLLVLSLVLGRRNAPEDLPVVALGLSLLFFLALTAGLLDHEYRTRRIWMVFTKPVGAGTYLLARMLGAWTMGCGAILMIAGALELQGILIPGSDTLRIAPVVNWCLFLLPVASFLVGTSAFLPSFTNSLVFAGMLFAAASSDLLERHAPGWGLALRVFSETLLPPTKSVLGTDGLDWGGVLRFLSFTVGGFLVGLLALRRREPGVRSA